MAVINKTAKVAAINAIVAAMPIAAAMTSNDLSKVVTAARTSLKTAGSATRKPPIAQHPIATINAAATATGANSRVRRRMRLHRKD